MTYTKLEGLVAATHTPFSNEGLLDLAIIEKQAAHIISNGVVAAFIGGTTGESSSLTTTERLSLAKRWSEVLKGSSMKLIVHVGSNCLIDSCELAKQAESIGAYATSAVGPSYFKPRSISTLVEWCSQIAKSAPALPFYYYDIPSMTGMQLPMHEFLEQGAETIPNLTGLKYSNMDQVTYQLCLQARGGRFDVPWGTDECLAAALALGCVGAVGSTYNFAAPVYNRLIRHFKNAEWNDVRKEQFRSVQLVQLLSSFGYMAAAKATMGMLGVRVGSPRLPNTSLSADQIKTLQGKLEHLGFFEWIKSTSYSSV